MNNLVSKFTPAVEADTDDAGLTTVEYAVAGSLIAAAVVVAFTALGANVQHIIEGITNALPGT